MTIESVRDARALFAIKLDCIHVCTSHVYVEQR